MMGQFVLFQCDRMEICIWGLLGKFGGQREEVDKPIYFYSIGTRWMGQLHMTLDRTTVDQRHV
jgi:hypothetical protein